ncbi:hypothetical protein [Sansalvadorimonas verongulae]|uniref:hypothetical protein n=1 Tax=Sansalvadorimonas verongulae TaxID=2172824 RepID=UPI0012BCFD4E|nr:hypothetical protein [Sansalvadorimonas verongulae]MTI12141.1 hypothetical protein [Sansalvadorimonas verongulae]
MAKDNVLTFPARLEHLRQKSRLADYLRTMADYIDSDATECEPEAILMVLSGDKYHEVLGIGHDDKEGLFGEAAASAFSHSRCTYNRRGGNKYDRRV